MQKIQEVHSAEDRGLSPCLETEIHIKMHILYARLTLTVCYVFFDAFVFKKVRKCPKIRAFCMKNIVYVQKNDWKKLSVMVDFEWSIMSGRFDASMDI